MKTFFLLVLIVTSGLAGCVTAVGTSGRVVIRDDNVRVGIIFTDRDRQLIHRYYHSPRHGGRKSPPGLAKRGRLPHGLAKRDVLPRELAKRVLPAELDSTLSPLSRGHVRVIVGGDVIILNRNTRVVIDIYRDVVVY